ncbi:MAG: uncharacterized protein QOG34_47 [Frankiaceae bacterium]|nr:uncharacterized protein [Frankiaceae bacterium]
MPPPRVVVRRSPIHGRGLFANRDIATGEDVIEFGGALVPWSRVRLHRERSGETAAHTFLFDVGDGLVIDGGRNGNSARWINHSCEPNCEAVLDGHRVLIVAARDIAAGEELFLDYQLELDHEPDAEEAALYACACGAPSCRSTMLHI